MKTSSFNRERFLLSLVAWVLAVQFIIFMLAAIECVRIAETRTSIGAQLKAPPRFDATFCVQLPDKLQDHVNQSLGVLLALLGGGAIAVDEIRRAKKTKEEEEEEALPPGSDKSQAG